MTGNQASQRTMNNIINEYCIDLISCVFLFSIIYLLVYLFFIIRDLNKVKTNSIRSSHTLQKAGFLLACLSQSCLGFAFLWLESLAILLNPIQSLRAERVLID